MAVLLPLLAGFMALALFVYGGKVQGRGERAYIASAARAFVGPWLAIVLGLVWARWWGGASFLYAVGSLLPAAIIPNVVAFAVWRRFRG